MTAMPAIPSRSNQLKRAKSLDQQTENWKSIVHLAYFIKIIILLTPVYRNM